MSSNKRNRQRPPSLSRRSSSGFDLFVATKMQNTRWRYNRAMVESRNNSRSSRSESIIIEDSESETGTVAKRQLSAVKARSAYTSFMGNSHISKGSSRH
ncbi:hypothetical protein RRG08_030279 [Elysia crispata]|uniref:Uncharacterized protein n=1 Tax=Elysia crispata TaxID=231223 RepID=A0AAE1AH40_9GAST|nr:hypothetical protein RRG08_030279 [Elysia crispata]